MFVIFVYVQSSDYVARSVDIGLYCDDPWGNFGSVYIDYRLNQGPVIKVVTRDTNWNLPNPKYFRPIWGHIKAIGTPGSPTPVPYVRDPNNGTLTVQDSTTKTMKPDCYVMFYSLTRFMIDWCVLNQNYDANGPKRLNQLSSMTGRSLAEWQQQTRNINRNHNLGLSSKNIEVVAKAMHQMTNQLSHLHQLLNADYFDGRERVSMVKCLKSNITTMYKMPLKILCCIDYDNNGYCWLDQDTRIPSLPVVGAHTFGICVYSVCEVCDVYDVCDV